MADLKQKTAQVITASTPVRLFTTTTILHWALLGPHTSNTGTILIGATSGSEPLVLATGDDAVYLPKYLDAKTIFVNSAAVSNQAFLLYIQES